MSAGDPDTLAALLAKHDHWNIDNDADMTPRCKCGHPVMVDGRIAHRAHVADVLLASDWLREQRVEAWKAGHGWCDDGDLGCDHEPFTPNPYLED